MLTGFPIYPYFEKGNAFSGAEGGMRYLLAPAKETDADGQEHKCLKATIWPGPWSLEHTAEEKLQSKAFPASQEGLDAAAGWLAEQYAAKRELWDNIPSILDCEPDR